MIKPIFLACLLPVLIPLSIWKWYKDRPQTLPVCRDHVLMAPDQCREGAHIGALAEAPDADVYILCTCPDSPGGVVFWK